jgi:hypothetical protein
MATSFTVGDIPFGTLPKGTPAVELSSSFAVLPVSPDSVFWEMFARTGDSGTWKLVTPPGIADNGGLVAASGGAQALTVAVRPSQDLTFSPLAATSDDGASWSPGGPLGGAVAASPDAFAADGSHLAALLSGGAIETSADGGSSWSTLARAGAIAASPAARGCGSFTVTALSFGVSPENLLAGGACGAGGSGGTDAVFGYSPGGGWQRMDPPASGRLVGFTHGTALVAGKSGLSALWNGFGWYAYSPQAASSPQPTSWIKSAPLPLPGPVVSSGNLTGAGAWVLLSGGRAATITLADAEMTAAKAAPQWTRLPPVPAGTSVLASGPDGATDALAVAGSTVTVWRLKAGAAAWKQVQVISVPIQSGSSS